MPLEPQVLSLQTTPLISSFYLVIKIAFLTLFALYFIFALLVIRQVQLMTDTLITNVSPILRALAIVHAGLALATLIIFIGLL